MGEIVEVPNTGTRKNIFPKYQIELGPWDRGLNNSDDPTLLGSDVLVDCVNLSINSDGRLRIRPQVTRQFPDETFDSVDPTITYIRGMGSIRMANDDIVPLICLYGNNPDFGGNGKITFWRYTELDDSSGTIPAVPAWKETYAEIDYPYTTDEIWLIPLQVLVYDIQHFIIFNRKGYQTTPDVSTALGTTPLMGPNRMDGDAYGGSPPDETFIRKGLIFKDRIFLHSDKDVYWTTINPTGVPDDWTEATVNPAFNAGYLGLNRELTHDRVHDMCVYQDELYILGSTAITKLSWDTDPGVDGIFTVVASTLGGQTFALINGDLYVFNGFGLYRLVTNYFVEVSEPVRDFIRASCKGQPEALKVLDGSLDQYDERPVVGMYQLDKLCLIGPFNENSQSRYDEVADPYSCNIYLVYSADTQTWSKWQFNPNQPDVYPIAGPSQNEIMIMALNDPAFKDRYVWVGRQLVSGSKPGVGVYGQGVYSMEAVANLINSGTPPVGWDDAGNGRHKPIGIRMQTAQVDLGDSDKWKRLQTSLLESRYYKEPELTEGSVQMAYVLDDPSSSEMDADRIINLDPVSTDRLAFGGAYRCHRFGFLYDSLTGVDATADNDADLDLIKKFSMYITLSSKDTSGKAN